MAILKMGLLLNKIISTVQKAKTTKASDKQLRQISREINNIKNHTEYIKQTGKKFPTTDFTKYLNIIK